MMLLLLLLRWMAKGIVILKLGIHVMTESRHVHEAAMMETVC
jgi:hypothetical protein